MLTDAGGTWSGLNLIGTILTGVIGYELYMSSLINRLFYFNAHPDEKKKESKEPKDKKGKKTNNEADLSQDNDAVNEKTEMLDNAEDDENE